MNTVSIDRFVKEIAARLPEKVEHVRDDITYMPGSELKLTGIKSFRGKPIEDDVLYEISVPVVKGKFDGSQPVIKRVDHEQELRRAYLAKGLPGIYSYLAPYLSSESLKRVKDTFMKVER